MFGLGIPEIIILLVMFIICLLPLYINVSLSKKKGKNAVLVFFLTLLFSWLVTIVLVFLPTKQQA